MRCPPGKSGPEFLPFCTQHGRHPLEILSMLTMLIVGARAHLIKHKLERFRQGLLTPEASDCDTL